jgi:hypothetical protein
LQKAASVLLAVLCCSVTAFAQQETEPSDRARIRLGSLALLPRVGLTNVGIDTNVFNQLENAKRDFTATVAPQTDFWLRLGKARVSGNAALNYVYFGHYASERAVNTYDRIRVEAPLNRLTAYATTVLVNARERSGYDIDARVRRSERTVSLGVDMRVGRKTAAGIARWRTGVSFGADEVVLGNRVADALDRTADGLRASLWHRLTPLTTLLVEADAQRDRFDVSAGRDADTLRIMSGVDLDPFALISGSARVGYRWHDARSSDAPGFSGLVAATDLSYALLGATRFSIHVERDIAYSFDVAERYYLQTGVSTDVTQKVSPRWDVRTRWAWYRLDYKHVQAHALGAGRRDGVREVGAGVGLSVGPRTRLGVDVNHYNRRSDRSIREFNGLRLNTSVTYGS